MRSTAACGLVTIAITIAVRVRVRGAGAHVGTGVGGISIRDGSGGCSRYQPRSLMDICQRPLDVE